MQTFKDLLESDRAYIFDGAMGTMLYSKGIYINRSYDELNLVAADLVREVHSEYVRAGADIIETNTFGANVNKLLPYGLDGSARVINIKAARIAREAAGNRALVAGAVGPLGLRIEPYGPTSFDEAKAMFADQVSALLEGGVDLFVLETFSDISELHQAIRAVRELCDLPIVAQVTIQLDGNTSFGTTADVFTKQLDEWGADVIGLNCGVGHAIVLNAIEKMRTFTTRKLSAQPNAGLPRDVGGRQIYMCSPEYMAEYSRRIIQAGARFVGGCCGTTPAHIKLIADALRQLSPRTGQVTVPEVTKVSIKDLKPPDVNVVPAEERSNWARKIAKGEFVTTVEVLPPKGCNPRKTLDSIRLLKDAGVNPGAVNMEEEMRRFEWKIEAGAEYAITQPVFDTEQLRDFLKRIEHCRIPIVAGIWPLVSFRNAEFLHNEVPGVHVTPEIMDRMRAASAISKEAGRDEGLKIARESLAEVRDLIQGVQVSAPFGNVKYALEVFSVLPKFSLQTEAAAPAV